MRQYLIFFFLETSFHGTFILLGLHPLLLKTLLLKAPAIVDLAGLMKNEEFCNHFNNFHLKIRDSSCK